MIQQNTKQERHAPLFLLKLFIQFGLYLLLQIVFIPFAIIGLLFGVYKEMVKSKKLGVSFSAVQALQYRWIMHYFDTRPDPLSVEFTKHFPCESHFGLWATLGPLIISQRYFGFTTRLGKLVEPGEETIDSTAGIRVLKFDKIMQKYVDRVQQIVIPGSGFDLIALHFTKGKNIRVFELDQVATLEVKVETLKRANIEHDWITYIPVDYSREDWVDRLMESGFDKTKSSLFLWQSVSLYLEDEVVKESLRKMADLSAEGSIIVQDFYSSAFMSGEISKMAKRNMKMIERMGEPWKFAIDMAEDPEEAVDAFLDECGFKMTEFTLFGEKLGLEPFYCIVEARKAQ